MMKYKVMARRNADAQWSAWSDTDDINRVIEFVDRIRELGWEAKVSDHTVSTNAVINYINEGITKHEEQRDAHKDLCDTSFYMICNTQISTLVSVKEFIERLVMG